MVMAKLHIICGNCGSSDNFEYDIYDFFDDEKESEHERVNIICKNCITVHALEDNAKES